jgi:NADPH:quinone reductase-like Zn-dependent oxidoreductase
LQERLIAVAPEGVKVAFDAVGGPQASDIAEAMAHCGKLMHGALSADPTPFPVKLALKRSLTYRGYVYTEVTQNPAALRRAHAFIAAGIRAGVLRPQIDRVFALTDVVAAHAYLESNQQFRQGRDDGPGRARGLIANAPSATILEVTLQGSP